MKGFGLIGIIIGVVLLLVAGTGAYYLGRNQNASKEASSQSTPVSQTPTQLTPLPAKSTPETENWKTYINTKYSYEIKYPAEISYDEYLTNGDTRFYLTSDGKNNKTPTGLKDSFTIFVAKELGQPYQEEISFNNVSGVKMKPNENFPLDYYLSPSGKEMPILRIYSSIDYSTVSSSANKQVQEIFNKMLNTFKFVN